MDVPNTAGTQKETQPVGGGSPTLQGHLPARRDLSLNHPSQLPRLTEWVLQLLPPVFAPFLQILFVFTHTHTRQGREAVAGSLSYTCFSPDPT